VSTSIGTAIVASDEFLSLAKDFLLFKIDSIEVVATTTVSANCSGLANVLPAVFFDVFPNYTVLSTLSIARADTAIEVQVISQAQKGVKVNYPMPMLVSNFTGVPIAGTQNWMTCYGYTGSSGLYLGIGYFQGPSFTTTSSFPVVSLSVRARLSFACPLQAN
jgi:hypothetical protein